MSNFRKVMLLDGSRTPILEFGAKASRLKVEKLATHAMRHAMRRAGVQPWQVSGVIMGHAFQSPLTPNTGRDVWLRAGWPDSVPAHTLQMQCGSGMKAVNTAMDQIRLGYGEVFLAGGAESMSTTCYVVDGLLRFKGIREKPYTKFFANYGRGMMPKIIDALARSMGNGFIARKFNGFFVGVSKYGPRPYIGIAEDALQPTVLVGDMKTVNMSGTAENVATMCGITREQMDAYALRSQQLAQAAIKSGRFAREIDPIFDGKDLIWHDQHPRETTAEKLARLPGANGTKNMTAGNSSGVNDGACMLVLASENFVAAAGYKPLAVLVDHCEAGVPHETMGLGPVAAITELLKRNNLTVADIDLFEINEAFAAQYLGCEKLLGLDRDKVNVNGGAIALGHPIAMSGARLVLTLAHELKIRGLKRGIASLCIGGGMGIATLIENPEAA